MLWLLYIILFWLTLAECPVNVFTWTGAVFDMLIQLSIEFPDIEIAFWTAGVVRVCFCVFSPFLHICKHASTWLTEEMFVLLMIDPCLLRDAEFVANRAVASSVCGLPMVFKIVEISEHLSTKLASQTAIRA